MLDRILHAAASVLAPRAIAIAPAALRVATGAFHVWYVGSRQTMLRRLHRGEPENFAPVGPVTVLKQPLPPAVADGLAAASVATGALFTVGIAHRVVGPVHAALQTWVLSYRNSWGMIYHHENNLLLHTAVLGAAPSADALSLDAALRDGTLTPHRVSWMYGLTPTVMNAAATATYLIAGIAKLRGPAGLQWADGAGMRQQVAADAVRKDNFGSTSAPLGRLLYPHRPAWTAMAVGSLAIELLAPVALLHPRAGRVVAVLAFGMHWGIYLVMNIKFPYNLSGVMFLPFLVVRKGLC